MANHPAEPDEEPPRASLSNVLGVEKKLAVQKFLKKKRVLSIPESVIRLTWKQHQDIGGT